MYGYISYIIIHILWIFMRVMYIYTYSCMKNFLPSTFLLYINEYNIKWIYVMSLRNYML